MHSATDLRWKVCTRMNWLIFHSILSCCPAFSSVQQMAEKGVDISMTNVLQPRAWLHSVENAVKNVDIIRVKLCSLFSLVYRLIKFRIQVGIGKSIRCIVLMASSSSYIARCKPWDKQTDKITRQQYAYIPKTQITAYPGIAWIEFSMKPFEFLTIRDRWQYCNQNP